MVVSGDRYATTPSAGLPMYVSLPLSYSSLPLLLFIGESADPVGILLHLFMSYRDYLVSKWRWFHVSRVLGRLARNRTQMRLQMRPPKWSQLLPICLDSLVVSALFTGVHREVSRTMSERVQPA